MRKLGMAFEHDEASENYLYEIDGYKRAADC